MSTANEYLEKLIETISRSGDPHKPFHYLGGPMTGIPQYNFPRFKEVADTLRGNTYNIISPAELDDPEDEAAALSSSDGAFGPHWNRYLCRDLIIVSLPQCVGGIFLEGWHNSKGARGESWVLQFLGRPIYEYLDSALQGKPGLTEIVRDERLAELDVPAEGVPTDVPGERTAAAREGKQWVSSPGAVEIASDYRANERAQAVRRTFEVLPGGRA